MSTTTQLTLYNGALRLLGQAELASTEENREPRHILDGEYEDKDGISACLEQGLWNFAMRAAKLEYNSAIDPDFGLQRAFDKPTDFVKLAQATSDEHFQSPLTDPAFKIEAGYFFSDLEEIYVRYVSDDDAYGKDFSLWPLSFINMTEAYFAWKIAPRIDPALTKDMKDYFLDERKRARSTDAMQEGVKFFPETGWQSARRGRYGSRRDLGSRSNLTG
jgi:hypothetical protein